MNETAQTQNESLRLVGYFPKKTTLPTWWQAIAGSAHVTEICSVSSCVAKPPDRWIDRWLHNDWGFFNSQAVAHSVVPRGSDGFAVFAYRLFPLRFVQGETERLAFGDLQVDPLPRDFHSLGFDVVSKSSAAFFECSPLSCNGIADQVAVNCYCLLENLAEAVSVADRFSREEPEPGPYYILDVLRGTT